MSPTLITFFTAIFPILERGAIPLGIGKFGLPAGEVFLLVTIGNMLPVLPFLLFLKFGSVWASEKIPAIKKMLKWVFEHTRKRHGHKFEAFGFFALLLLVAIPSPITGVWTASVVAYLIDMPIKKAFFAILGGVVLANAFVMAATIGVMKIF